MYKQKTIIRRLPTWLAAILILIFSLLIAGRLQQMTAQALPGQVNAPRVTLNPGGGAQTDGSDGIRFTINADGMGAIAGQDEVYYRNTQQYCCSAGAPMLNIGGTLYGQAGPAYDSNVATWSSIQIISTSGSTATGDRTSATGNASATVRYTVVKNDLSYTIDRTVSYTYPNDFITDTYTFNIPTGNTEVVKFYNGGDTAPGSSDQGYGIMLTSPVRSIISLNTSSQIMYGFREIPGSKPFDGATSQSFSTPYQTVKLGNDIGFVGQAMNHDAGLMMQWNLGSAPGTQTASFQQFATKQGTNLNAAFAANISGISSPINLDISIVNTVLSTASNLGYTLTLPANLQIGSGTPSNTCGGTLTATPGQGIITLSGGSVSSATNCIVSIPTVAAIPDTYTISAANITNTAGLTNNVGTSSLLITEDRDGDGVDNTIEDGAPNNGDGNGDGASDSTQLHVTSLLNTVTGKYSTIVVDEACNLADVQIKQSNELINDEGYTYPLGLLDFSADCGTPGFTTTVTQYYYDPPTQEFILRKFANNSYRTVSGATIETQTIAGRPVLVISYQVTDGGELDDDNTENGVIVDPAGPAFIATVSAATSTNPAATSDIPSTPNTGLQQSSSNLLVGAIVIGATLLIYRIPTLRNLVSRVFAKNN